MSMPLRFLSAIVVLCALASPGFAADKLTVGKSTAQGFAWLPADVGVAAGIFAKLGLDVELVAFTGGARLHQAFPAGSVDIGLGSGTDLAFLIKGTPEKAVANMADLPLDIGINTLDSSGIKTIDDLKGARIGVSSPGSLTDWLARELARSKGWGPNGVTPVAVGGNWPAFIAAMETKQVSATIGDPALGFQLAEQKRGRLLSPASDYVKEFIAHVIFASDDLINKNPDALRRFLRGWFESVTYMHTHRAEGFQVALKLGDLSPAVTEKDYDLVLPMFSRDGKFPAAGLKVIARSFVELGQLETEPDLSKVITEDFLPQS
jgi:ABC-type nitrate/sulfonate/bicarbonate transport system substrate-binding protein